VGASKLVIVGLDGATFDLIIPWIEAGKLKTFERFVKGGAWGELKSTLPPLTCPAWPSFMTGKNPGKFGINDFVIREKDGERVVNFSDILGEPFWDTAGREGRRSIIVNVPVTYPPQIINGILLSGMMTPPGKPFWSRDEVIKDLRRSAGNYVVDLDMLTVSSLNRERSLGKLYAMMENRFKLVAHLKDHYPFDLMAVVFRAPDIVCHRLWDRKDVILRVYEMIDGYLGHLVNDTDHFFLMSDHGFRAFSKGIRINQHLYELGVLVRRKIEFKDGSFRGSTRIEKEKFGARANWVQGTTGVPWKMFLKLGMTRSSVAKVLERIGLYDGVRRYFPRVLRRVLPVSRFAVDRESSRAYLDSRRTRGIIINRNLCDSGTYLDFRNLIRQSLLDLKDPESGARVIRNVSLREEVYQGKYAERFPDLYVEPEEDYLLRDDFGGKIVHRFLAPRPNHDSMGVFAAYGPDIFAGRHIEGLEIMDVAPTALHLLNAAVPEDMDGRVVKEIFKSDSEAFTREIRYSSPVQRSGAMEASLSREDESAVRASLKALGYMD
jgi:predicted AlkP superfamily phosphohydrolase/phosphomutase